MTSVRRRPIIIALVVLLLIIVTFSIAMVWYQSSRPLLLFLQDGTYAQVNWPLTRRSLVKEARKAGYSCVAVTLEDASFATPDKLKSTTQELILQHDPRIVLFSPLISSALDFSGYTYDMFVDTQGITPFLCGMGGAVDGAGLFDIVFSPSAGSGWDDAARTLAASEGVTPLMTSLLYQAGDADGEAALEYFRQAFPEDRLLVEEQKDTKGSRWAASVLNDLSRYSVLQVASPYVDQLDSFFTEGSGLAWTVDARYSDIVPKKELAGTVCDDLGSTIGVLFAGALPPDLSAAKRGMALPLSLVRTYRPAKTGWRSFF